DYEVLSGYTSDLLSDVMGNADEGSVLITIQAHRNSVAVASQLDFPAIIICNNRPIPAEMENAARSSDIAILKTTDNQFVASYKVYAALKRMS
ncbi:MAG TPA: iron-sulfur binding hydrogenase, partial [Spirochaetota bacterium]